MIDEKEVFLKVRKSIADALGLDEEEVLMESRLIGDLGAESLDFLDIAFRLERAFNIKIPRGGIQKRSMEGIPEEEYEKDGFLTPIAIERLKEVMKEVPPEEFNREGGLRVKDIPLLFRVETFYNIVISLLKLKEEGKELPPY